jgi:GNAT superfamily N-acetyltransferase
MSSATDYDVRPMRSDDRSAVIELLAQTQRWVPGALFEQFFAWKHLENPFGESPAWVATAGERIIGLRIFLRWEFEHPDGGVRRAVRAVDTATHPDFQGRGIFTRLTLDGLEQLRADGVDFVFNTPNEKSRPGYLKMGWVDVGRLSAAVRPSSPVALARMLRSRVPAERWSTKSDAGYAASELLTDCRVPQLLRSSSPPSRLRTRRSVAYLRWRYSFESLAYRAVALSDDAARGIAIFRLRRRGAATEAALCELIAPDDDPGATRDLERAVARASNADYVIRLGRSSMPTLYVRLPGQGPALTWRAVSEAARPPGLDEWGLQLGDIELF